MSTSRVLTLALLLVSLPACKGAETEKKADTSAASAPTPAADPAAPEAGGAPVAAGEGEGEGEGDTGTDTETGEEQEEQPPLPASFEQVGVELCDTYVKDFVACIDSKVPEAEREALRRQVFINIEAWKQTAAGGASAKQGLQTGCRIAREQAKRATQDWGCEW
ncbi:hypothetical protein DB30_05061 [Enhygromyxa salina]|uniref:Lipoprotein n=1 Tax=Enhygromyxa salina TaxID=215803 RepID=A0A0C2D7K4_9BACT|nr:hypothetical protein [Enhygromyxa salina]KIG16007.1 hypothetical protein DB30_05061 [Enhygromyxa salina]